MGTSFKLINFFMDKTRQELLQSARKKLSKASYSVEQREQILRTLDLLLEVARDDERTEENARATARLLSNITHHHNLLAILQQQAAELDALKRISVNLTSSLELQTVLDAVVTEAMRLIKDARDAHIFLYVDGQLRFGASLDHEEKRNVVFSLPRPNGLTYTVARNKKVIVVEDLRNDPLFGDADREWSGSIVGMPLMMSDDVIGVMNMARWSVGGFKDSEIRLLDLLADQAALAIINARLHQAVSAQALSDTLTGLPNRRALDARLESEVKRSGRYAHQFAVLMMDLDGFKAINDTFGHTVGDEILRQFAQYLAASQRESDFLARYGGDEMTMILPETNLESAQQVAEKIKGRMDLFVVDLPDGSTRQLGLTGGIAIFPIHARTASDLLRAADEALYRAKRHSRGGFLPARIGTGELPPLKNLK
jgi:diguanylate cyclase (GGDEF)-like protein